jgi:putative transposase
MDQELTHHVGREKHERKEGVVDYQPRSLLREDQISLYYTDGVNFRMRIKDGIDLVPVLVCIGVKEDGTKLVLSLQSGDKESASSWREFFRDLKKRGLDGSSVQLGIMDGLPGLDKVFRKSSLMQRFNTTLRDSLHTQEVGLLAY